MPKMILFFKKRDGLATEDFVNFYENTHVPRIFATFPKTRRHTRNYIHRPAPSDAASTAPSDFDVISEVTFDTEQDFNEMMALRGDANLMAGILADEHHLFDQDPRTFAMVMVDEKVTPSDPANDLIEEVE